MGKFNVARVFTDGCVLQRNKDIVVFGTGEDGKNIKVSLGGHTVAAKVEDAKWRAVLPKMEAANDLVLSVTCEGDEKIFKDVCIGEVWLAGGQSNMEYELKDAVGGCDMLKNDNLNVRYYATPKYQYEDDKFLPLQDESRWEHFDSEKSAHWSAVAYMFARELSEKLNVTVGIINCNWGGTSASCWVSKEDANDSWEVKSYLTDYEKDNEGKSLETQKAEYEEYLAFRAEWEPKCAKMYEENPNVEWSTVIETLGSDRYPGPVNSFSPHRPFGLYETMLSKVIGYSMAGVIYYQGESDDHKTYAYYGLFNKLIKRWRKDNGDDKLPFIAVQLPMHRFRNDPDFKNWPHIRKAQRKVAFDSKRVGLAVCIDCGEWDNIHPRNKTAVAHRLVLQALWIAYGLIDGKEANGPCVQSVEFSKDAAYVTFDYAEGGFVIKGDEIKGFEVAGFITGPKSEEDYEPAIVEILSDNRIKISSPSGYAPGSVRYLWTNWGDVTLYGVNGIPVEPFYA